MKLLVYFSLLISMTLFAHEQVKLDESFDPTSLNDWGQSRVRVEQIKTLGEYLQGLGDLPDTLQQAQRSEFIFRVQLTSTRDMEEAKAIEERAIETFADEVVVQFDSPYYKIRVGKMNNREDAQSLQRIALQNGYRRAWVVRTVNKPSPEK